MTEGISLSALMVIYVPGSGVYRESAMSAGDESAEPAFWKVTSEAGLETKLLQASQWTQKDAVTSTSEGGAILSFQSGPGL